MILSGNIGMHDTECVRQRQRDRRQVYIQRRHSDVRMMAFFLDNGLEELAEVMEASAALRGVQGRVKFEFEPGHIPKYVGVLQGTQLQQTTVRSSRV